MISKQQVTINKENPSFLQNLEIMCFTSVLRLDWGTVTPRRSIKFDTNCSNDQTLRVLRDHNCLFWLCVTHLLQLLTESGPSESPTPVMTSEMCAAGQTLGPCCPLLHLVLLLYNRTYGAMETLTEPHTLTATLSCMIGMARSLISPNNHYPEGRAHVLPLLIGSLPGVDPNDFSKCMVSNECVD